MQKFSIVAAITLLLQSSLFLSASANSRASRALDDLLMREHSEQSAPEGSNSRVTEKFILSGRFDRALWKFYASSKNQVVNDSTMERLLLLMIAGRYGEVVQLSEHYIKQHPNSSSKQLAVVNDYAGTACLNFAPHKSSGFFLAEASLDKEADDYAKFGIAMADLAQKKISKLPPLNANMTAVDKSITTLLRETTGVPIVENRKFTNSKLSASSTQKDVMRLVEEARQEENLGHFESAQKLYSAALNLQTDSPELLNSLAICALSAVILGQSAPATRRSELKFSEDLLRKAHELDSHNWKIQNNLAACCFARDDFKGAIVELENAKSYSDVPQTQLKLINFTTTYCKTICVVDEALGRR